MTPALIAELLPSNCGLMPLSSRERQVKYVGFKYVPVLDYPPEEEGFSFTRKLYPESHGWERVPEDEDGFREVTKLQLLENFLALDPTGAAFLGFKAYLQAALPPLDYLRWEAASAVSSNHPTVVQFKEQLKAGLGLTEDQFRALLTPQEEV